MAVRPPRMVLGHGWILVYSLIYLFSMHLNTVPLRVVPILLYDLRGAFVVNVHPMCSITTIEARLFIANIRYRSITLRLGLGRIKLEKKEACPARVAKAGQGNIETVHEPEPIQTTGTPCMDKVAVLWKIPMAHKLRYMKELVPSR